MPLSVLGTNLDISSYFCAMVYQKMTVRDREMNSRCKNFVRRFELFTEQVTTCSKRRKRLYTFQFLTSQGRESQTKKVFDILPTYKKCLTQVQSKPTSQYRPVRNMTDNYYYDDDFEYYKASTRDAGPWLLIGVCAYSTLCLVLLPISLSLWKKWERRRAQYSKTTNEPAKDFENMIEEPDCSLQVDVQMVECEVNKNDEVSFESAPPSPPRAISPTKQKHAKGGKYTNIPDMDIECNNQSTDDDDVSTLDKFQKYHDYCTPRQCSHAIFTCFDPGPIIGYCI